MPTLAQSGPGKVTALWSTALIRGANGKMRLLKVGDLVHPGDVILTTQDGIVQIDTNENARMLAAGPRETPAANEIDRVIAGLNEGDADVAPAAGLAGGGDGNLEAGLRVDRIAEGLTPGAEPAASSDLGTRPGDVTPVAPERYTAASAQPPGPPPAPPLSADSSAISAAEEGATTALGLAAPTGAAADATIAVTQVPAIGEIRKADGTLVTAGTVLTAAELTGLSYVPPAEHDGIAPVGSFSYTVTSNGETASGSTAITLAAVNDAPMATPATSSGLEDGTLPVSLTGTDVDGFITGVTVGTIPAGSMLLLGDGLTAVSAGQTLSPAQAANLLFRPAPDYNGSAGIVFTVTDNGGLVSAPATYSLVVSAVNDAPNSASDGVSTAEDTPVTFDVLGNDSDAEGDALSIVAVAGQPIAVGAPVALPQGSVALNADGTLSFTPNPDFNGTVSFGYTVSDGTATSTGAVSVTVTPTPDAALIGGLTVGATVEDTALTSSGTLTIVDADTGEAAFVPQTSVSGAHGSFSIDAAGAWTYTLNNADPAVQALGSGQSLPAESFTVASIDGTTRVITVSITGTNDAAVITAGVGSVTEDTAPTTGGTLSATDVDNATLAFVPATTSGSYGALVLAANGAWTYTLDARAESLAQGQTVSEAFTVALDDGSTTTVTLTVTGTNDAPVAQAAAATVTEDAAALNGAVTATDLDGAAVLMYALNGAAPAGLNFNANGSYAFDPSNTAYRSLGAGQSQVLTIPYTVTDEHGATSSANLVITVTGTNDAPVAQAAAFSVAEGAPVVGGTLLATDIDAGAVITYELGAPAPAGLTLTPNGSYTFDADVAAYNALAVGQSVVLTVPYTATDDQGATSTANLVITVTGTNDTPVAQPVLFSVAEDAPLVSGNVVATDPDSGAVLTHALLGPAPAGLVLNTDGSYTFNPADPAYQSLGLGDARVVNVPYLVTDEHGAGSIAGFVIVVIGTNDVPVALADAASVAEDGSVVIDVRANDSDSEGTPLTITQIAGLPIATGGTVALPQGSVTLNADGTLTFTPNPDFTGSVDFGYTVSDGVASSSATVHVDVTPVNDAPVAQAAAFTAAEDAAVVSGAVVATDVDAGAVLAFALNGAAPAGLSFNPDGSYSFDPSNADYQSLGVGQSTVITVPYTVTDDQGATSSANLVITVTGTNDAPVAQAASFAVAEDAAIVNGNVGATDVDANAILGYALNGAAPAGLVFNADGSYSFDASNAAYRALAAGQVAVLTIPYTVSDQFGASSSANLVVTISGSNDAAIVTGVASGSVTEDGTLLAAGSLSATDVDSAATFAPASASGTYGNFSIDAAGAWTYTLRNGDANVQALTSSQHPTETFNVTTTDGTMQQIAVTVNGSSEAPVAIVTPGSGAEDAAEIPVTLAGSDADGAIASFTITALPDNGTLLFGGVPVGIGSVVPASAGSASLSFVPAADWNGSTSLSFRATDAEDANSPAVSQSISVSAVNDAPVAVADSASTSINTPLASIAVLTNDTDVDGDVLSVVSAALADPALGSVAINADGTLAFAPALNVTGAVLVNYTVRDPSGATSVATLSVNVGDNTAPTGTDAVVTLAEDGSRAFSAADFGFADADAGQTLAAVRIDALPASGSLTFSGTPVALGQLIPAGGLGSLVYIPAPDANGNAYASFGFSVQDSAGAFDASPNTITLNVTPVADAAVIGGTTGGVTVEDTTLVASGVLTIADPDAGEAAFVAQTNVAGAHGAFSVDAAGAWTYTLNNADPAVQALAQGQTLPVETYTVASLDGTTQTITVSITGTNDAPVAQAASYGVAEDGALLSGAVSATDADAGAVLGYALTGAAPAGLVFNTDGSFSFDPAHAAYQSLAAGQSQVIAVPYRVTDDQGASSLANLVITVTGTNDAPVAQAAAFTVLEDAAVVTGSVIATDVDAGAVLAYALTGAAPAGLTFNANGTYSFDPSNTAYQALGAGQTTVVAVPYRVTDDQGATSIANLVITVTGTNDGPVAAADTGSLNENATLTATAATGVLANDTDVDTGDTKAVSGIAFGATTGTVGSALNGTYGTLTLNADGSYSYAANRPAAEALTAGQIVTESFTYTMRDAAGATSPATITFTVTGTNDVPTITGPLTGAVTEDSTLTSTGTLVTSDPDAGQSSFAVQTGTAGTYGSFSITATGTWTYTLNNAAANVQSLPAGAAVTDSFTVTTADGTTRTVVITVNGTNDGPVAVADVGTAVEAGGVANATAGTNPSGNVLGNDTDIDTDDTRTVSAVSGTGAGTVGGSTAGFYGTLTLNADGTYSYALNNSLAAVQALRTAANTLTDTFTYTVRDGAGATSSTTLTVTIQGANDAPVAVVDTGALAENATLTTTAATGVLANDTDVDAGDTRVVSAVAFGATPGTVGSALNGTYGTLTLNVDGSYSYSANRPAAEALTAGQVVTEAYTYTVRDAAGATSSTTLTFTVTGANDVPTVTGPLTGTVKEDTTLTSTGTLVVVDADAGQSSFVAQSGSVGTYGSFSITPAGAWTYTLNNAAGNVQALGATASVTDSFTVVTADGTTRTVVVTVNGTNDAPVAAADSAAASEDTALTINAATLLANDTDRDTGDALSISSVQAASGGTVALNGAGNVVFTPTANYSGPASFTYTVSDGNGGASTSTVNLTIAAVADAPTLTAPAQVFLLTQGATSGNTSAQISQATIEGALGLPSGRLDNFNPAAGPSTSDPGNVDFVDGKFNTYDVALGGGNQVNFNWQFFNGEDLVSEINEGFNDLLVVVVTDPTGAKQYFQIISSEQLGRNTNGSAVDATGTFSFTTTAAGHYQFDWIVGNGRDDGKDSSMTIAAPTVTVGGTTYGAPVYLGIAAGLVDTDGSESLALTVSGVPSGATLSAGTSLGGGAWSLSAADLNGLSLLPASGYTGTVNLVVTATSTEASNGSTASSTQTIAVTVDATTNSIAGTSAGETLAGTTSDDVVYGYGGNDTLTGDNGNDILYGGAGSDSLNGGAGNDILYGGSGSDALTGGAGADVFAWSLADRGTAGTPPTDTISDFSVALPSAGGDLLDLRDLLQGENRVGGTGNLDKYLDFDTTSSAGSTIIRISSSGGFTGGVYNAGAEDQRIVLTGVDVRSAATFGLSASATDNQIIAELINRGKLITDGP